MSTIVNNSLLAKSNVCKYIISGINDKYKHIHKYKEWIARVMTKNVKNDLFYRCLVYLGESNYLGFYSESYRKRIDDALAEGDRNKTYKMIIHTPRFGDNLYDIEKHEMISLNMLTEKMCINIRYVPDLESCREEVYSYFEGEYLKFQTKVSMEGKIIDIREFLLSVLNKEACEKHRSIAKTKFLQELKIMKRNI